MNKLSFLIINALAIFILSSNSFAQFLTMPADGGNKKASVSENIGITEIKINYHRPGVKGRDGKIWGNLVHYGFVNQGFGKNTPAPWRAGANQNTTISFSTDVRVEGQKINAGSYGLFMAMEENSATVIFSKNSTSWGSYFYDEAEDVLRVKVKTEKTNDLQEWLKYEFTNETDSTAVISLVWERLRIPFKVEVEVKETVLESMRRELRNNNGFTWQAWNQAVNYCLANNFNLGEALVWADYSINAPFVGQKNFVTLKTKSDVLFALGKKSEAEKVMKEALPLGNAFELHQYGRQLLNQKRPTEALEVFKKNAEKNNNAWPTNVGLVRGYSAVGDYKNALKYAQLALAQVPSDMEKNNIENMIKLLKENKDVNSN